MSLFGSLMADVEDDPFFGSHMRHMRQMNNMMNSLFADPFGMLGDGPLAITGARHSNSLMPFMPQMPSLNRLFSAARDVDLPLPGNDFPARRDNLLALPVSNLTDGHMSTGSSFSSSTVVMSSGLSGSPQVFSSTSSMKIGPNGVKETRKTLQDSRTGLKKMSIGHHIGERAHVIEREQNVFSGDAEERQEFINLDEEEAEDFDREFQVRAGAARSRARAALPPAPAHAPRLALPPAPSAHALPHAHAHPHSSAAERRHRPQPRRPLRTAASPLALPTSGVREVYGGSHPQRHRHKHHRHRHSPVDN